MHFLVNLQMRGVLWYFQFANVFCLDATFLVLFKFQIFRNKRIAYTFLLMQNQENFNLLIPQCIEAAVYGIFSIL